ncbi:MAG: hypothetical protein ACFWTL_02900 [Atopobium sp.]
MPEAASEPEMVQSCSIPAAAVGYTMVQPPSTSTSWPVT